MEDLELIEKYLRKELKPDEAAQVKERLAVDPVFKRKFEAESLLFKSLQFSRERERMKSYAMAPAQLASSAVQWLDSKALMMAGAMALAVWIFSTFSHGLTSLSPEYIKWIGLTIAVAGSMILVTLRTKTLNPRLIAAALSHGLLVFVLASGFDAINHGAEDIADADANEASLIPFTEHTPWWPTESLEDSLDANRKKIQEMRDHIRTLVASRLSAGPKMNFGYIPQKFTPVIIPRSTTVSSGATYEADLFLATSPVGQKFEMFVDGKPISIEADPSGVMRGKISFTASADRFDNTGVARKKFVAQVKMGDSTYRKGVEYIVAKPK